MGGGSHFVAMTTPMSLQPWWWQIFILIQLWSQFFQMFVYGDVVYAQTWYWPWKTVSSHLHMPGRPMLLQYGPHFFSTLSEKFGQLERFFGQMVYRPPWQKITPTPMIVCYKVCWSDQNTVNKFFKQLELIKQRIIIIEAFHNIPRNQMILEKKNEFTISANTLTVAVFLRKFSWSHYVSQ